MFRQKDHHERGSVLTAVSKTAGFVMLDANLISIHKKNFAPARGLS